MTKDQEWISEHFEELVNKYGGRYIAVMGQKIVAIGDSPKEVDDTARKKEPGKIPSVMHVPREEALTCIL